MSRNKMELKMIKTYKFKLYQNDDTKKLDKVLLISGNVWNHAIALQKRHYKIFGKKVGKFTLQKHLTKLKKMEKHAHWRAIPSQAFQQIVERVENSYTLFFSNVKNKIKASPPKFRKSSKYKSFTLKQAGYKITGNSIVLTGRGWKHKTKFFKSREIPSNIKTITIKKDTRGNYFMFITAEVEKPNRATTGKIAGIDFGLKTFLTLSDGRKIESPLFFFQDLKEIRKANRKLSKKVKYSKNYMKAKRELSRLHEKIANRRNDWHHKTSTALAVEFDEIFIEDLCLKGMKKLWGRKISDLAYYKFILMLEYKTEKFAKVDRFFPSTRLCHVCGVVSEKKELNIREWTCQCGAHHDRDENAAINIRVAGHSHLQ